MNKQFTLLFIIVLIPLFQNCSPAFQAKNLGSIDNGSLAVPDPDPSPSPSPSPTATPTPTPTPPKAGTLVTVAVGVGGRIIVGKDGFATVLLDEERFSEDEQASIKADPNDATKLICPAPSKQIGMECCYGAEHECIGGGWHSDFLYRGVAYGNGRFVAAGGASYAIARTSTDGVNWSPKYNLIPGSGLVTGTQDNAWWIGDIAFGNGRFVAAEGAGHLYYSTDGQHWTTSNKVMPTGGYFRNIYFLGDRFYGSADNGTWGFSVDGSEWASTGTGGIAPTEIYTVGDYHYGWSGDNLYRLSKADAAKNLNNWTVVKTVTGIGTFVYNPVAKTFNLMANYRIYRATDPFGTWSDDYYPWWAPGRWAHHSGEYFIGPLSWSSDGLTWNNTPSPHDYKQPIIDFASGVVQ
jgi:hypothetical protein